MKKILTILFISSLWLSSCDPNTNNPCASNFDQLALLSNIGNHIIAPTYQKLASEADSLNAYTITFANTPNVSNLAALRSKFQQTWTSWQTAAIFEFGPAATENLRSFMNNFPVFVTRLNDAITSGTYDLTSETYSYTRGFPALDYLLYGIGATDNDVVAQYTTDAKATNRQQYLKNVAALIAQKANTVNNAWQATGANYLATFTATEGVANGKPLSDLVNQLSMSYELIKNNKLGVPISAKTSYVPLLPQHVEAAYSRTSLDLAIAAVEANKNVFLGKYNGLDSIGLDDFLMATAAKKGGQDLHTVILNQYDLAITNLNTLKPSTLYDAINNNLNGVKAAYAAAQNQMVNIKTDMPSALCVNITYVDNVDDGD